MQLENSFSFNKQNGSLDNGNVQNSSSLNFFINKKHPYYSDAVYMQFLMPSLEKPTGKTSRLASNTKPFFFDKSNTKTSKQTIFPNAISLFKCAVYARCITLISYTILVPGKRQWVECLLYNDAHFKPYLFFNISL